MTMTFRGLAAATALAISTVAAQANPMVGGAPMYANKNIIQNAVNSKDHTTLVAAVKAAGLVKTLEGKGPFTVFAPTNEAFAKLPKGTVATLLKPENKAKLSEDPRMPRAGGERDRRPRSRRWPIAWRAWRRSRPSAAARLTR